MGEWSAEEKYAHAQAGEVNCVQSSGAAGGFVAVCVRLRSTLFKLKVI